MASSTGPVLTGNLSLSLIDPKDAVALAIYYQTHAVPQLFNPGIVVASVVVSILGAYTTLLLLGRRTATNGWRNWFLLGLAATTMAGVGIWSMHFLGMNAMALRASSDVTWFIQFSPGFTVLSLFVPLIALALAFVFVGIGPESYPAPPRATATEDSLTGPLDRRQSAIEADSNDVKVEQETSVEYVTDLTADGGGEENETGVSVHTASDVRLTSASAPPTPTTRTVRKGRTDDGRSSMYRAGSSRLWRLVADAVGFRLALGGILCGGTIALMHYCAAFSASFRPEYSFPQTISAIILACVASTLSLLIFFRLHAQWQNNWWKRLMCSTFLASAVCGMHYLGVSGTSWHVRPGQLQGFTNGHRNSTVLTIAISVMCFALCVICFIILVSDYLVTQNSRRNARRVVVASATFDQAGRLLVKPDGMLPISVIETTLPLKDILTELNYREYTFQWLFMLSWDWSMLDPFLPRILASALSRSNRVRQSGTKEFASSFTASKNHAQIIRFRDRCLEATALLANELGLEVKQMGLLFDNVLRTGTRAADPKADGGQRRGADKPKGDEESSLWSVSAAVPRHEGVMLFLVRQITHEGQDTHDSYVRRGYRFAETRYFSPVLADRVAVEKPEIDGLFEQLKLYAKRGMAPCVQADGVYVSFFGVRPSVSRQGGLDSLVYSFCHHQVPAYRLPDVHTSGLGPESREWLQSLAGLSMRDIASLCDPDGEDDLVLQQRSEEMVTLQSSLGLAVEAMLEGLKVFDGVEIKAKLTPELLSLPSSDDDSAEAATLIMFECVLPPATRTSRYDSSLPQDFNGSFKVLNPYPTFAFVPYTLFSKSQAMLIKGTAAKKFARQVRVEMTKRYPPSAESMHAAFFAKKEASLPRPTAFERVLGGLALSAEAQVQVPTPAQLEAASARRRGSNGNATRTRPVFASPASEITVVGSPSNEPGKLYSSSTPKKPGLINGAMFQHPNDTDEKASQAFAPPGLFYLPPGPPASALTRQHSTRSADLVDAPSSGLSAAQAQHILGSPIKTLGVGVNRGQPIPLQRRPSTANSGVSPSLPSARSVSATRDPAGASPSRLAVTKAKMSAGAEARLRADDWHTRRLDSLEHGEGRHELLGVQW